MSALDERGDRHGFIAVRADWKPLVLAHAWLAVSMIAWRVIEGAPKTAAVAGGEFAASTAGRALALVTVLGGVVALVVVIAWTFRLRRDVRALLLFAVLCGAVWDRAAFDAFDIAFLALVAIAVALVCVPAARTTLKTSARI